MAFSPPVLGCLVKKGLQKGGSRAPQDPHGYALVAYFGFVLQLYFSVTRSSLFFIQ